MIPPWIVRIISNADFIYAMGPTRVFIHVVGENIKIRFSYFYVFNILIVSNTSPVQLIVCIVSSRTSFASPQNVGDTQNDT